VVSEQSNFDFGFNPKPVISASGRFVDRWDIEKLRGQSPVDFLMPRAAAASGVTMVSWYGSGTPDGLQVTSDDIARDGYPLMAGRYTIAGPHFIQTVGVPMIAGRDFIEGDDAGTGAVILDDSAAKALFPTGSAVGRRVRLGRSSSNEPWRPVIGVVRSAWLQLPNAPPSNRWPRVYVSMPNPDRRVWGLVARAEGDAPGATLRIKRELASVLPLSVRVDVAPLTAAHDASLRSQRQLIGLFGTLAGGALLFAAAGLFAVLSYVVSHRMREFGIRVAIGAQRADVLRLVMRDAMEMALGGTAIGGLIGVLGAAIVAPAIFGVDTMSVVALIVAEGALIAVTLLASLVPALRATRADAVDVLRAT
jgi:putative ABC transport system permease protein